MNYFVCRNLNRALETWIVLIDKRSIDLAEKSALKILFEFARSREKFVRKEQTWAPQMRSESPQMLLSHGEVLQGRSKPLDTRWYNDFR